MIDPELLANRHPSTRALAQYFDYAHLSDELGCLSVSAINCATAEEMIRRLPDGTELSAGLRKLLEAKDCFARACLPVRM